MTNEQIEHMLPGPQWAAYRARLEQGQILTTRELAARLHVNPATIRAHVKAGSIPAFKVGRRWRYDLNLVMEALSHER